MTDTAFDVEKEGFQVRTVGESLVALCKGPTELLMRPCVDCGLVTGRYCDGEEEDAGPPCFAENRIPNEVWIENQRTPLCSVCDNLHNRCRFCRGMFSCTPPKKT